MHFTEAQQYAIRGVTLSTHEQQAIPPFGETRNYSVSEKPVLERARSNLGIELSAEATNEAPAQKD
jgi:hypothetical protein